MGKARQSPSRGLVPRDPRECNFDVRQGNFFPGFVQRSRRFTVDKLGLNQTDGLRGWESIRSAGAHTQ